MIPVFVGYDTREQVTYHVFSQSVLARTRRTVGFFPVTGEQRDASNSFVYARFRVAHDMGYKGWALFADGDMICRADIGALWDLRDPRYDVMVAKHDYKTKFPIKYLGQRNDDYPRKNWSSVMLINCESPTWRAVTPKYIAAASGAHLHRFEFLQDERVGSLPLEWNWLVSEYAYNPAAKIAHFTVGAPCWSEYADCDYADEWRSELANVTATAASQTT